MTMRDYFAAKAMLGEMSNGESDQEKIAEWAYNQADAMLAARSATPLQDAGELVEAVEALLNWAEEFALPAMGDDTEGGQAYIGSVEAALSRAKERQS